MFGAAEGPFAVNNPVVTEHLTDKGVKGLRIGEVPQFAAEGDLVIGKSLLESLGELASKNERQHLARQKEAITRIHRDPAPMIKGQSARRNNAMDMRMVIHFLSPAMQEAEETDLGAKVFGIAGNLDQRFGTETQQQGVDKLLVLQCQRR